MHTVQGIGPTGPADRRQGAAFDRWHSWTCRTYSETRSRQRTGGHFSARGEYWEFGSTHLRDMTISSASPIHFTRSREDIQKDSREDLVWILLIEGDCRVTQDGRHASPRVGDMVLYCQARPFEMEVSEKFRAISLNSLMPLLSIGPRRVSELTALPLAGGSRFGRLASTVLHQLAHLEDAGDAAARARLGASAIDIVTTAFEAQFLEAAVPRPGHARLLDQAKRYMLANLHDATLDLAGIAKAQNIAPRTLNRLFAAEGATPIRWLWQQRLAASYRALAEGRVDRVTHAAFDFGFKDLSHFSRSFRRTFGISPHSLK